jgi:hypothetical protein
MKGYKIFKIYQPPSARFLKIAIKERGWNLKVFLEQFKNYPFPKEDYLLASKKYPIFAVADGVTLLPTPDGTYPYPSGAGEVAKIFCEKAIKFVEDNYNNFSEKKIVAAFNYANKVIGEYNRVRGRTKKTINYGDFDFFHATAALSVVKRSKIFWGTICDAGVVLMNKRRVKFQSPPCHLFNRLKPRAGYAKLTSNEKTIYLHKFCRNKIDKDGNPIGYGVLTGEREVIKYVRSGMLAPMKGDLLFVFTDGFNDYLKIKQFTNLFFKWPPHIGERVRKITSKMSTQKPKIFGHERSLIVVKIL